MLGGPKLISFYRLWLALREACSWKVLTYPFWNQLCDPQAHRTVIPHRWSLVHPVSPRWATMWYLKSIYLTGSGCAQNSTAGKPKWPLKPSQSFLQPPPAFSQFWHLEKVIFLQGCQGFPPWPHKKGKNPTTHLYRWRDQLGQGRGACLV